MMQPLPATQGSADPAYGPRVASNRSKADRTVLPDIEAAASTAQVALPIPAKMSLQLVSGVKAPALLLTLR